MDNDDSINSLCFDDEKFEENINKVVMCLSDKIDFAMFGKLIRVSKGFITLERRNGTVYNVAKSALIYMEPVRSGC